MIGAHRPRLTLVSGMGGQSPGQYRAQMLLWSVLGAPLILSNDIRSMDAASLALVTNPEGARP